MGKWRMQLAIYIISIGSEQGSNLVGDATACTN